MSRHWVVDASPIILLAKTGHLVLLPTTTDKLLIPKAVAEEIRQAPSDDPARTWLDAEGEQFVEPTGPLAETVAAWDLGRGESRVLSVGVRRDGWTALVDDGAARRCGKGLDIPIIGTLGLLVVAKREGDLAAVRPVTKALRRAGLHVDDDVVDQVLRMVGEA
jgi:predicted nucleic acid-binding protein